VTDAAPEVFIKVSFAVRTDDEDGIREEAAKFAASLQDRYRTDLGTNVTLSKWFMCCGGSAAPIGHHTPVCTWKKDREKT